MNYYLISCIKNRSNTLDIEQMFNTISKFGEYKVNLINFMDAQEEEIKKEINNKIDSSKKGVIHIYLTNSKEDSIIQESIKSVINKNNNLKIIVQISTSKYAILKTNLPFINNEEIYCTKNEMTRTELLKKGARHVFIIPDSIKTEKEEKDNVNLSEILDLNFNIHHMDYEKDKKTIIFFSSITEESKILELIYIANLLKKNNFQAIIIRDNNEDFCFIKKIKEIITKKQIPITLIAEKKTKKDTINKLISISDILVINSNENYYEVLYSILQEKIIFQTQDLETIKHLKKKGIEINLAHTEIVIDKKPFLEYTTKQQFEIIEKNTNNNSNDYNNLENIRQNLVLKENKKEENIYLKNKAIIKCEFSENSQFRVIKKMTGFLFISGDKTESLIKNFKIIT